MRLRIGERVTAAVMAGVVLSGGVLTSPAFAGDPYLVFDDITRCLEGPFLQPPPSFNPGDVGCIPVVNTNNPGKLVTTWEIIHLQEFETNSKTVTIQIIPSSHNTVSVDRYEVPATGDSSAFRNPPVGIDTDTCYGNGRNVAATRPTGQAMSRFVYCHVIDDKIDVRDNSDPNPRGEVSFKTVVTGLGSRSDNKVTYTVAVKDIQEQGDTGGIEIGPALRCPVPNPAPNPPPVPQNDATYQDCLVNGQPAQTLSYQDKPLNDWRNGHTEQFVVTPSTPMAANSGLVSLSHPDVSVNVTKTDATSSAPAHQLMRYIRFDTSTFSDGQPGHRTRRPGRGQPSPESFPAFDTVTPYPANSPNTTPNLSALLYAINNSPNDTVPTPGTQFRGRRTVGAKTPPLTLHRSPLNRTERANINNLARRICRANVGPTAGPEFAPYPGGPQS